MKFTHTLLLLALVAATLPAQTATTSADAAPLPAQTATASADAAPLPAQPATTSAVAAPLSAQTATTSAGAAPATSVVVDLSTPKLALVTLFYATERGDQAAMRQVLHLSDPENQPILQTIAGMAHAIAQLRGAMVEKFGPRGAGPLVGDSQQSQKKLAAIQAAQVQIDNDQATVILSDGSPVQTLTRIDGQWRLSLDQLLDAQQRQVMRQRQGEIERQRVVFLAVAEQVRAGKFNNAEQVAEAIARQLLTPDTQPTTAPVK